MAVTDRLRCLAARAPIPVYVAAGAGADGVLATLRAQPDVVVVATPRHATVLLVAGRVPADLQEPLRLVHDQVPSPRATAVVADDPAGLGIPAARILDAGDLAGGLRRLHSDVVGGRHDDPALGPAANPVDWQGVGPHGHGGEGMMGGRPYGRPMAMLADGGRDGLALDRLSLQFGPFLPGLPPLVTVRAGLQGDVLETVALEVAHAVPGTASGPAASGPLAALAELLALAGLTALARRAARLATATDLAPADLAQLRGRLDRAWGLRAATDGIGRLDLDGIGGDVTDRWRRWFDRAAEPGVAARATPVDVDALADALVGMELGQARLTLASLRPELAATATAAVEPA